MTATIKTWGQALDFTWRVKWKRMRSAKTNAINAGHVTAYAGRSLPLARMTKAGWWLEFKAEMEEQKRSGSTINRILSAGTTVMKFTKQAGEHNYECPTFERADEGKHRLTWFTKEEVDKLALISRDLFGDRWGNNLADAILVSAYTGVRQGELLKLRPDDYNPALDALIIGGKPWNQTKSGSVRQIEVNPKIKPIITDRLGQSRLFHEDWNNKDQLYKAFTKVRQIAGFDDSYVWHTLRHSFGTWVGAVSHPRTVMELLGHSTIDMSLKYCKATDEATRSAVMAI